MKRRMLILGSAAVVAVPSVALPKYQFWATYHYDMLGRQWIVSYPGGVAGVSETYLTDHDLTIEEYIDQVLRDGARSKIV